jgi:hypothetical protein
MIARVPERADALSQRHRCAEKICSVACPIVVASVLFHTYSALLPVSLGGKLTGRDIVAGGQVYCFDVLTTHL